MPRMSATETFQVWLDNKDPFNVAPKLTAMPGCQNRNAATRQSLFCLTLADTAPDARARRVIVRAHAKRRTLLQRVDTVTTVAASYSA